MSVPTVYLVSNGNYWQARWRDSSGKEHGRSLGRKVDMNKAQAKRAARKVERQLEDQPGRVTAGRAPALADWLDAYMARRPEISDETARLYIQTQQYLLEFFSPSLKIDRIDRNRAADFRAWLSKRKNRQRRTIAETTVRKHIRHCRVIFGAKHGALKYDLIAYNPFDREIAAMPPIDQDWHYVSRDDLKRVFTACPNSDWKALIALCRLASTRLNEAIGLDWDDVDFENRRISIMPAGRRQGHIQTTKKRGRIIPMDPLLHDVLLAHFELAEPGATRVVGLAESYIRGQQSGYRTLRRIVKAAGLEMWHKPYHTLRKNCETDWLQLYPVMDVAKWVGHSPAVAQKYYHQPRPEIMDQAAGVAETDLDRLKRENAQLRRMIENKEHQS